MKGPMPHLRGRVAYRFQLLQPRSVSVPVTFWQKAWGHLMHGSHPASSGAPRDIIARLEAPRLPPCCVRRTRPGGHVGLLCGCLVGPLHGARCQRHHDDRDRAGGAFSTLPSLRAAAHNDHFSIYSALELVPSLSGHTTAGEYLREAVGTDKNRFSGNSRIQRCTEAKTTEEQGA